MADEQTCTRSHKFNLYGMHLSVYLGDGTYKLIGPCMKCGTPIVMETIG